MGGTLELTSLRFDFAQDGIDPSRGLEGLPNSLNKLFDHISTFDTIAKRAVIFPGTDATKHP